MNANTVTEFQETLIDPDFLEFCESVDKPVESFERCKFELYRRSLGVSKKPMTEIDQAVALEDLSLFNKGIGRAG